MCAGHLDCRCRRRRCQARGAQLLRARDGDRHAAGFEAAGRIEPFVLDQEALAAEGLLSITAGDNVVRLAPPLVITDADIDEAAAMLRRGALRCLPSDAKAAAK